MSQLPPGFILDQQRGGVYSLPPSPEQAAQTSNTQMNTRRTQADIGNDAARLRLEQERLAIAREAAAREARTYTATHDENGAPITPPEKPQQYSQSAIDSFDRAIGSIGTLKTHPGLSAAVGSGLDPASWGTYNPFTGNTMAGTQAAGFNARLSALKAQVFLPMVQGLKGMGQLSNAEGEKLTDAIGALDPSMPEDDFLKSMDEIKNQLTTYRNRSASKVMPQDVNGILANALAGVPKQTTPPRREQPGTNPQPGKGWWGDAPRKQTGGAKFLGFE